MRKSFNLKTLGVVLSGVLLLALFAGVAAAKHPLDNKIAWYAPAPHPYFEEVRKGVEAFEKDYGIQVIKQVGPDWKQASENEGVEALAAKGARYFSIFPADASGANGLYEELTSMGMKVVSFGAPTTLPTTASFLVATDVKKAAMIATEELIKFMGGKGKIINILEVLEDPNTVLRKQGVEEVVAKYPEVEIIQEIAGMQSVEEAIQKIESAVSANIEEVDGLIATGYTISVAIAQFLSEYYSKGGKRTIHAIGIDTDPIVLKAIKEGYMDATIAQNPFGHGYISCLLLKYLAEGWKPKKDAYFINAGVVLVTKDNLDTFQEEVLAKTKEIVASLEEKYLEK